MSTCRDATRRARRGARDRAASGGFNLLNTANFGAPAAQLGPASFGTITTALDPRVVQLAAKFWF
jgi:hypothetical protein